MSGAWDINEDDIISSPEFATSFVELGGLRHEINICVEEPDFPSLYTISTFSNASGLIKAIYTTDERIVWTTDESFMHPNNIDGENFEAEFFSQFGVINEKLALKISSASNPDEEGIDNLIQFINFQNLALNEFRLRNQVCLSLNLGQFRIELPLFRYKDDFIRMKTEMYLKSIF